MLPLGGASVAAMAKLSKAVVRRRSKSILTPRQRPQSCEIAAAQRLSAEVLDARSAACDLENKRSQLRPMLQAARKRSGPISPYSKSFRKMPSGRRANSRDRWTLRTDKDRACRSSPSSAKMSKA